MAIVALGVLLIGKWDEPLPFKEDSSLWIIAGAVAEGACIMTIAGEGSGGEKLLWAVIGGSLLLASTTDSLLCQVYNFTWWLSLAAALTLLWYRRAVLLANGFQHTDALPALLFIAIQLLFGGHIYGRADSYAFCVCALAETSLGLSAAGLLTHMLLAYLFLFAVQLFCRNLNRKGNLQKPVPFVPYITAAFWMTLILCSSGR